MLLQSNVFTSLGQALANPNTERPLPAPADYLNVSPTKTGKGFQIVADTIPEETKDSPSTYDVIVFDDDLDQKEQHKASNRV